jgi:hypothetical protein
MLEYGPDAAKVKAKALSKGERFKYIFMVATSKEKRGKGTAL